MLGAFQENADVCVGCERRKKEAHFDALKLLHHGLREKS